MDDDRSLEDLLQDLTDSLWTGSSGFWGSLTAIQSRLDAGEAPERSAVQTLLEILRRNRRFNEIVSFSQVVRDDTHYTDLAKTFVAQAHIDLGAIDPAQDVLETLLAKDQLTNDARSQALGLMGRASKQLYVSTRDHGLEGRDDHMRAALSAHATAFAATPISDKNLIWHGTNLVALAWRAGRDGIRTDLDLDRVRAQLRDVIARLDRSGSSNAWSEAAKAQCCLSEGDRDGAARAYRSYFTRLRSDRAPGGQVFTVGGDLRQLKEIWDLPKDDPLVSAMQTAMLALTNPDLDDDDAQAIWDSVGKIPEGQEVLQAIIGTGFAVTVEAMQRMVKCGTGICRVQSSSTAIGTKGTGFLIDGAELGLPGDEPVLVTNAHVLGGDRSAFPTGDPIPLTAAEVVFDGLGLTVGVDPEPIWCGVQADKATSHDVTIARLTGEHRGRGLEPLTLQGPKHRLLARDQNRDGLGFVVPVGHPRGGPLAFSFGENTVLDHYLDKGGAQPAYLHYTANTEDGSSGCPILSVDGKVLAVHTLFSQTPLEPRRSRLPRVYRANQGIGMDSILKAARLQRFG